MTNFSSLFQFYIFLEVQGSHNISLNFPLFSFQHLPCFNCQSLSLLLLWFPCCVSSLQAVTDGVFWCGLPVFSHFQQHFLNLIVSSNSFLLQNPHWPLLVSCSFLFRGTAACCTLAVKPQQSQPPCHAKGFQYPLLQHDALCFPQFTKWIHSNAVLWLDCEHFFVSDGIQGIFWSIPHYSCCRQWDVPKYELLQRSTYTKVWLRVLETSDKLL